MFIVVHAFLLCCLLLKNEVGICHMCVVFL